MPFEATPEVGWEGGSGLIKQGDLVEEGESVDWALIRVGSLMLGIVPGMKQDRRGGCIYATVLSFLKMIDGSGRDERRWVVEKQEEERERSGCTDVCVCVCGWR